MEFLSANILPIAIGVIMFGIGINLRVDDFKRVFIKPKAILIGLSGQMLLLPLVAFILAYTFNLPPIHQLGIVLIAACPGGTASNIITFMLKGRVALSVSLTALNSLLILLTIPLLIGLASVVFFDEQEQVSLSYVAVFKELFFTVVLPVIVGVFVNEQFKSRLVQLKNALRYVLPLILFTVFTFILFAEKNEDNGITLSMYAYLAIPLLILNVGVMLIGHYLARTVGVNKTGSFTIAIEMGLQNTALAIFIAKEILQLNELAVLAVIYGGFSFFSTFIIAYFLKKMDN